MFSIFHLVFLAVYGLYVFFEVDRSKPLPWLVAHLGVLGFGAFAILTHADWYLMVGAGLGVALAAKSMFVDKVSLAGNVMKYFGDFVKNALFCPVQSFETLYQWVATKVNLPTLPKV